MSSTKKNSSEGNVGIRKSSSHVPGQYLGYSLQPTRFLARLLEAEPGWTVSLEVFEDVGVETPEGYRIAEQVKSTLDGNPVSDRAIDLWKTFSNWIDAVNYREINVEKTIFEIYVSQPKTGDIIKSFAGASTFEEAQQSLIAARDKLWGEAPGFKLKPKVRDAIKDYVSNVFEADQDKMCAIIKAFSLTCGSGSPQKDLKMLMKKLLVPPDIIDDTLQYAQGWVKENTDILLEQGKPAIISVDLFRLNVISFVRKHDRRTILDSLAKDPDQQEIEGQLKRHQTYIRQLDIIDCDYDEKIRAIKDFLQASINRTQWSVRSWVDESSFAEFEQGLLRTWQNLKRKTNIVLSHNNDSDKGKYLYSECLLHQAMLEGLAVPEHFVPGSFHALADKEEIGWHPE